MEPAPESDITAMNFNDTELTLRLPGDQRFGSVTRGGHSFKTVDLNLESCSGLPRGKAFSNGDESYSEVSSTGKCPGAMEAEVVGWPPVRGWFRKKCLGLGRCKYVKVAVDGAPYLRKVDLEGYGSYQELMRALEEMFTCFLNSSEESKLMDSVKGIQYVPTYQDKDGDWMLVGDVPWKMFEESCKRIRLMKRSEATEIG